MTDTTTPSRAARSGRRRGPVLRVRLSRLRLQARWVSARRPADHRGGRAAALRRHPGRLDDRRPRHRTAPAAHRACGHIARLRARADELGGA